MIGRVLLIDGRSGSGKTELASAIVEGAPHVQLLRLDDLYPGWGGLDAASATVADVLASPEPRWRRWDWATNAPAEWHELDPARPLVVEGCGALSRAARAHADFGVWVALDAGLRKRRALERDGDAYAPHWDGWAAQEEAFLVRENPAALADAIVDGHAVTVDLGRWRGILGV